MFKILIPVMAIAIIAAASTPAHAALIPNALIPNALIPNAIEIGASLNGRVIGVELPSKADEPN